jgi:cytidine deaminase
MSDNELEQIKFPELVFGVAGAVGIDTTQVTDVLNDALTSVGYKANCIKITSEMYKASGESPPSPMLDYFSIIESKILYANEQRSKRGDPALMAKIGIRAIRRERQKLARERNPRDVDGQNVPEKAAYIINQLKRPEEVALLRKVYGRQFILVSAYGSFNDRRSLIIRRIKSSGHTQLPDHEVNALAESLIATDAEESHPFGQRLRETFHLADVFVGGIHRAETEFHTDRFVDAFFGRTDLSPSKEEYGMYAAKSASLRSSDLSRQVGAAIFSPDGEIITQGCNEVPKALGGTYWDLEEPDFRDVMLGSDPNENLRNDIIKDLFDKLRTGGYLSKKAKDLGSASSIADALTAKSKISNGKEVPGGVLADALIMDLTEYGRVVHAEMCAICDAARLGKSIKGSTLYCTTFPCHNCTKHILAVGVKRVVYMEPYPKSRAKELHENEISIEVDNPEKVTFMPFLGISPYRYRDIFQKGKRKGAGGIAKRWLHGEPRPMVEVVAPTHIELEAMALGSLIGVIKPLQDAAEAAS